MHRKQLKAALYVLMLPLLAGCASTGWHAGGASPTADNACAAVYAMVERATTTDGVIDAEARRVPGFPYLRVNRLLADVEGRLGDPTDPIRAAAWVDAMAGLDEDGRRAEIANLSTEGQQNLSRRVGILMGSNERIEAALETCSVRLRREDLASRERLEALRGAVTTPDHYRDWWRVVGLYPVTAIPVSVGWEMWKERHLASFARDQMVDVGAVVTYAPPLSKDEPLTAAQAAGIVDRSRDPVLGIPRPVGVDRDLLIATFAPVWRVEATGDYDRIGTPTWVKGNDLPQVDTGRPAVFTRIGHATVGQDVLLQLVYQVWFPERPRDGPLDLLAGHMDGLIWRVTLGHDGTPVLYDTIHACGCYHLFFPVLPHRIRTAAEANSVFEEVPAAPAMAPAMGRGERFVLTIAGRTHYLLSVTAEQSAARKGVVSVPFVDDHVLRSLPLPDGGRRSLFDEDGLVAGTDRLERFLLWPMGVMSPGAMRQWGTHATAFVGRRHFDDPRLIERWVTR